MERYKYLGTCIDKNMNFNDNINMLCKKGQQYLYCLDRTLMTLFYKSCIESVLTFPLLCWYGNLSVKSKSSLNRIVKLSSNILGVHQSSLSDLFTRQAKSILSEATHPLFNEFQSLPSGSRSSFRAVKTNRYRHSFSPTAISILNSKQRGGN